MGNTVDLNGWHLAAAITYDDVNAAIAKGKSSPTTFSVTADDKSASISNGTFGTWSLVRGTPLSQGAAGEDVTIQIPITGGSLKVGDVSAPIAPCNAIAVIRAAYIPQPGAPSKQALTPSQTPIDPASVEDCQPKQSTFLRQAAMVMLLQQWLEDNLGVFNQVFAVVDLEADFAKQPGLSWMKPTYLGYATAEPTQLPGQPVPKCVFAVLALIDGGKPTAKTVNTVSPFVIPDKADAGLVVSPDKFLQHFLLPALTYMFKGRPDPNNSFTVDNDEVQITSTVDLTLVDTTLESGKTVNPAVPAGQFSIDVVGAELQINLNEANYSPSLGFDASLYYKGSFNMALDTNNRILQLVDVSHAAGGSCQAEKGYEIAEIVIGVVSGVTAIVSGVAGGVAKAATSALNAAGDAATITEATANGIVDAEEAQNAVVSCCRGLISGTTQSMSQLAANLKTVSQIALIAASITGVTAGAMQIAQAVIDHDYSSAPKLDVITDTAFGDVVTWPSEVGGFKLATAQLNGCLQFGLTHA